MSIPQSRAGIIRITIKATKPSRDQLSDSRLPLLYPGTPIRTRTIYSKHLHCKSPSQLPLKASSLSNLQILSLATYSAKMRFIALTLATIVATTVTAMPAGETPPPAICLAICYFEKPDCGPDGVRNQSIMIVWN